MPDFQCGILFVHGIGEQRRGDTLIDAADPLVHWLQRWLAPSTRDRALGQARLTDARLSDDPNEPGVPAHAVLEIAVTDTDGSAPTRRWLLAEGRWAEEVRMPAFSRLAAWLLTTGAWILLSHGARAAATHKGSRWYYAKIAQAVVLSLVAVPVLQLVVSVLAIVAVLPIPRLRALLSDVLLRASGVLGDSYVLLESAVQREAIIASVRRHLRWMARQCDTVFVIAHSQGAAVAYHALRDADPDNVSLFITYGSGLAKLEEIELMRQRHGFALTTAQWGFPLAVVGSAIALRIWSQYPNDPWADRAVLLCSAPLMVALGMLMFAFQGGAGLAARLRGLSLRPIRAGLDWFDLYASADPVSNGPLTTPDAPIEGVVSRQVSNLGSVFADHTAYWRNGTEFIPAIVQRMDRHLVLGLCSDIDGQVMERAAAAHRFAVGGLTVARWAAAGAALALLWGLRQHAVTWGAGLVALLRLPVVSALGDIVTKPTMAVADLVSRITGIEAATAERYFFGGLGMLLVVGAVVGWHRLFHAAWRAWETAHARRLFARSEPVNARWWIAATGGIAAAPWIVAVAVLLWPEGRTLSITELQVYRLLGLTIVGLYWIFALVAVVRLAIQARANRLMPWSALAATILFVGFAAALTPGLFPSSLFDSLAKLWVIAANIGVLAYSLVRLAAHAQRMVRWWQAVTALPILIAVLAAIAVLGWRITPPTDEPLSGAAAAALVVYVLALLAVRGGLWLVGRRGPQKSARSSQESTAISEAASGQGEIQT